jgi:putative transposase
VEHLFIELGKPVRNAFIESFNGAICHECPNEHWFTRMAEARQMIDTWCADYSECRPQSSLGAGRSRAEFAVQAATTLRATP